ncbi:MAG: helix-turn-helix domain-containing protein [Gemmatimonadota bacterium]|nr:helix-turn-helix domain-containing protein [Gemmatimonadota bacterium]
MESLAPLLTKDEVCALIGGVAVSTLNLWVRKGKFPAPIRINGERLIRWQREEVRDWLDRQVSRPRISNPGRPRRRQARRPS